MEVHWKAPLQTKGFLKIIEFVGGACVNYNCMSLFESLMDYRVYRCLHYMMLLSNHDSPTPHHIQ